MDIEIIHKLGFNRIISHNRFFQYKNIELNMLLLVNKFDFRLFHNNIELFMNRQDVIPYIRNEIRTRKLNKLLNGPKRI